MRKKRAAERRDDAGIGVHLPVANTHALINADGEFAFALELLEFAEGFGLAVVFGCVGEILHAGDAVSRGFVDRRFHGLVLLCADSGGITRVDESGGRVFQDAGWIAVFVADDFAAGRIFRAAIDSGEFQRERIGERHVSVGAPEKHGVIAGRVVDQLVCRQVGRIPALMIPVAVAEPCAWRARLGELRDALREFGGTVGCAEFDGDERSAAVEEVNVRVVESGEQQAAVEVDDLGVGAGELADGGVVADGEDRVAVERDGVRDRRARDSRSRLCR